MRRDRAEGKMKRFCGFLTGVCACVSLLRADPFALGPDARVDPSQFRVTTFASGLPYYTTGMVQLPDGSFLVAANDSSVGGKFYASTGKLIRFTDNNHDGVADDSGTVLNSGLPGAIVQMR